MFISVNISRVSTNYAPYSINVTFSFIQPLNVDMDKEKENFYRINSLLLDCILPELHDFFIKSWNKEVPTNHWVDAEDNRKELIGKIKGGKRDALLRERILQGNIQHWDLTCVFKALSVLALDESVKKCIDTLKDVRNTMSHLSSSKTSNDEKDDIFQKVNDVYDQFKWPKERLEEAEHGDLTPEYVKQLKAKLEEEKKAGMPEG